MPSDVRLTAYETLKLRLRETMDRVGMSDRELSRRLGTNESYVGQVLSGKNGMPGGARLLQIAGILDTTTDYLTGKSDTAAQPLSEVSFRDVPQSFRGTGEGGLKVLGTGFCDDLAVEGDDGSPIQVERVLLETDHVVRLIERPAALWNVREAYAIYCHGSSMEPRFEQGDLAIVDPRRPPGPGDYVVAQLNDGNGEDVVTVLIKRLVRATSAMVELEQFNPPHIFRVPRRQVQRLHRILSNNEIYGA
jgi:transcriptional regulator with XRE-family HTH domain